MDVASAVQDLAVNHGGGTYTDWQSILDEPDGPFRNPPVYRHDDGDADGNTRFPVKMFPFIERRHFPHDTVWGLAAVDWHKSIIDGLWFLAVLKNRTINPPSENTQINSLSVSLTTRTKEAIGTSDDEPATPSAGYYKTATIRVNYTGVVSERDTKNIELRHDVPYMNSLIMYQTISNEISKALMTYREYEHEGKLREPGFTIEPRRERQRATRAPKKMTTQSTAARRVVEKETRRQGEAPESSFYDHLLQISEDDQTPPRPARRDPVSRRDAYTNIDDILDAL